MNNLDIEDKKVAVLGMGVEGIALAQFLGNKCRGITLLDQKTEEGLRKQNGNPELIKLLDDNSYARVFGPEYLDHLDNFDIVFRSPGIPFLNPKIQEALKVGVAVSSQIKLFFELCPSRIIGVTGTKGKGTTASLINQILKDKTPNGSLRDQKRKVYLAGNIGYPAITLLNHLSAEDIVILELSSFQIQDLDQSPHIAVITNISVDHLDYHSDEAEYHEAKESIVKFQTKEDFAIINQDYLTAFEFASLTPAKTYFFSGKNSVDEGAYVRLDKKSDNLYEVVLRVEDREEVICRSDEINLVGKHNLENIAAASIAANIAGANIDEIRAGVREFEPLPHRLEFVAEIEGIKYFNDSFATNPEPTIAAVDSFSEDKVLILGGSSKGADFDQLGAKIARSNVKSVVLIGDEAKNIKSSLLQNKYAGEIISADYDLNSAIKEAKEAAKSGDVIVFSPACASFDMFKNYKDRGDKFRAAVLNLT